MEEAKRIFWVTFVTQFIQVYKFECAVEETTVHVV